MKYLEYYNDVLLHPEYKKMPFLQEFIRILREKHSKYDRDKNLLNEDELFLSIKHWIITNSVITYNKINISNDIYELLETAHAPIDIFSKFHILGVEFKQISIIFNVVKNIEYISNFINIKELENKINNILYVRNN